MTDKATRTRLLAVCAVYALGSATPAMAADESYWCQMFPKFCGDEGTPGGAQRMPESGGAPAAPMSRGMSDDMMAPDAASSGSSAKPEMPKEPPKMDDTPATAE